MVHSTLCSPETSARLLRHVGFIHCHAWAGVVGGGWWVEGAWDPALED